MKTKILIVDDEIDARELMQELFESKGYISDTAKHGLEALNKIRESEPEIVISDIRMPEMDGMQLLEILSKNYSHIPVLMVTAHGTIESSALEHLPHRLGSRWCLRGALVGVGIRRPLLEATARSRRHSLRPDPAAFRRPAPGR